MFLRANYVLTAYVCNSNITILLGFYTRIIFYNEICARKCSIGYKSATACFLLECNGLSNSINYSRVCGPTSDSSCLPMETRKRKQQTYGPNGAIVV